MTTTWHRITRHDWYRDGIDSHDATDCPDLAACTGEVIPPGHNRHDLRDSWMQGEAKRRQATPESRAEGLADLSAKAASIQASIRNMVDDARLAGMTWEAIGAGLGISKQAAQQRYGS